MKNLLRVFKVKDRAVLPTKATKGSAGLDLYACIEEPIVIRPGDLVKVPTGICVGIQEDFVGLIFARSGLGIKHGITLSNGVGVIDSDYRGEICVGLCNVGKEAYEIVDGDRIAQMVLMKTENFIVQEVDSLDSTERGQSGFGSSGR